MVKNPPATYIYKMEGGWAQRKGNIPFQQPCISLTFGYYNGPNSPLRVVNAMHYGLRIRDWKTWQQHPPGLYSAPDTHTNTHHTNT